MPVAPTQTAKMLERVLSSRRSPPHADDNDDDAAADESKTKKHHPFSFFTTRLTFNLARLGPLWPCVAALSVALLLICSLVFHSRSFVCVSPHDPVYRSGFFGFDALESDFGSLGVPWCMCFSLRSDLSFFVWIVNN